MKANQLGELSVVELNAKLIDNLDSLQNLRFQKALQQLEDGTQIPIVKKEIAQIKTILREYDLGIRKSEGDA
ncbi:MAG: 50S ribosomal protein L29 [Candidatus Marinimicrobia bacterium]|nr:50S ribosomal protein L29 [Candidatus Neomarinimicrobiota bacterium]